MVAARPRETLRHVASFASYAARRNRSSEAPLCGAALGGRAGFARAPGLTRSTKLFVERRQGQLERLDGIVVRDDVVAVLEHRQQVAGERDVAGQALGDAGVEPHQPDRHVEGRPAPDADRGPQTLPELVPADDLGSAELEGAVRRFDSVDGGGEIRSHVVDPDRLDLLLARADDRRHRRQLRELPEGRQDAAVAAEDEARPEDHVLEAGSLDRLLHLPFGVVVGHEVPCRLARPEGAHQDEAPDSSLLRSRDEVAGALLHHALELLRTALADRYQVDDGVDAFGGRSQARLVRHLADHGSAREVAGAGRVADEQLQVVSLAGDRTYDLVADEAGPARDEDLHLDSVASRSKFCQYRLGVGPVWPWYFDPRSPEP